MSQAVMNRPWWAWAVVVGLGCTGVMADELHLTTVRDNTLFATSTPRSNGVGPAVFCGRTGGGGGGAKLRALLAFDLTESLPAGSTITGVSLILQLELAGETQQRVHSLHRVLGDWGEGNSDSFGGTGAPAQTGDATWNHRFFPGQLWVNDGGDFVSLPSSLTQVGGPGQYQWQATDEMIADVQHWLDHPEENFGWILIGEESTFHTARKFSSREAVDVAIRPHLTIQYEPPCPGDVDGNHVVDVLDLLAVVHAFGNCQACPADLNADGRVDREDILFVLDHRGDCNGEEKPHLGPPGTPPGRARKPQTSRKGTLHSR